MPRYGFATVREAGARMSARRAAVAIAGILAMMDATAAAQTTAPSDTQAMNPTQEIAKETPEGPAIVAGPTEIRIGGYLGGTGVHRPPNVRGGTPTSVGPLPYGDTGG